MDIRSDGLIGISFVDEFDWFDGIDDGYQLVSGYQSGIDDPEFTIMEGAGRAKCPIANS